MLNLTQSAALPAAIASLHPCRESIFNISNRASLVRSDADPDKKPDLAGQRDVLHAVLARIGCGQVLLKRGGLLDVSAIGRAILERECGAASGETLYRAVKQLVKLGFQAMLRLNFPRDRLREIAVTALNAARGAGRTTTGATAGNDAE
jgi:hypothetical protein